MHRLLAGLGALFLASGPAMAEPAMWVVSDEDSDITLLGSIHLLDETQSWQTETLNEALADADYYYYEVPVDAAAQGRMQTLAIQNGLYPEGETLSSKLSEEEQALLARVAGTLGMTSAQLDPYKPWLAYISLTALAVQQAGFNPESGVEMVMLERTDDEKERYFETVEQQIGFFADMTEEMQLTLLITVLEEIDTGTQQLFELVTAWKAGDTDTLDRIINESMRETNEEVFQTLIVARNNLWVEEIGTLIDEGAQEAVVIVGAGHMVGEAGLPAQLAARGYTVKRIQ